MNNTTLLTRSAWLAGAALAMTAGAVHADSGFYIGASAGGSTLEADLGVTDIPDLPDSIDEDDTAFKGYIGYNFDLPLINLGVEAGYVDFGQPEFDVLGSEVTLETNAWNVWGIVGVDAGLIDLFAKVGYAAWEAEASIQNVSDSTDGNDLAYGVGASFGLGPVSVRGEYELYEFDETDVTMLSVGVTYQF
ncbi:MAG: porin family protein [Pseudomonadota bacterium]